jgi:L-asparagine transporter-like permease
MFLGHRVQPGLFAVLLAAYQIVPRCIPVTSNWSVLLRRILAATALIAIVGIYLEYRFARIDLWTWMALLCSFLLLLDLYDHWLLNHLLSSDFMEGSHE